MVYLSRCRGKAAFFHRYCKEISAREQDKAQEAPFVSKGERMVSTEHTSTFTGAFGTLAPYGSQRITGKLLATQGYVIGIEISGSGARQSMALSDLNGNILHRVRRPLDYVPDTETVLRLLDE